MRTCDSVCQSRCRMQGRCVVAIQDAKDRKMMIDANAAKHYWKRDLKTFSGLERDSKPRVRPLRHRCNALPTGLSSSVMTAFVSIIMFTFCCYRRTFITILRLEYSCSFNSSISMKLNQKREKKTQKQANLCEAKAGELSRISISGSPLKEAGNSFQHYSNRYT